jgi:hypothetical protein
MAFRSVKVLIATIGLGLGSAASAEDPVYIGTDSSGAVWYYYADTIRKNSNNKVEVWTEMDASKDKTVSSYRTMRIRFRIDCSAETRAILAVYQYRPDGTLIDGSSRMTADMEPIVPGTFDQKLFNIMCPQ